MVDDPLTDAKKPLSQLMKKTLNECMDCTRQCRAPGRIGSQKPNLAH
jgi:hypothetical protein